MAMLEATRACTLLLESPMGSGKTVRTFRTWRRSSNWTRTKLVSSRCASCRAGPRGDVKRFAKEAANYKTVKPLHGESRSALARQPVVIISLRA